MEFQVPLNTNPELTKKLNKYAVRVNKRPLSSFGKLYTINIDDDIDEPKIYREVVAVLREAKKDDLIELQISSWGGYLDSAILLVNELLTTKATTIASIHTAGSAATLIAFACDKVWATEFSTIMMHNFSVSQHGKGKEVRVKAMFDQRQFKVLVERLYTGILTDKEIERLQDDEDIWLLGNELMDRMVQHDWEPLRERIKKEEPLL